MRHIIDHTNPALRQKARDIGVKDIKSARIRNLIRDMTNLLAKEPFGVALAAPQVGESLRLFIVAGKALVDRNDPQSNGDQNVPKDQVYINPVLKKLSRGKKEKNEGCLSIRGVWGDVPRAEKATVEAYDEQGKKFSRGASGFLAHIFQHEMDHLEGILYTDKAVKVYEEKRNSAD